ncbi:WYL domain-containing protein [Actinacidiphila sp. DG2A-62]|uniref:WYL domain-containing protein n=1 Tax=Actinacidiphila sp. DG2A-62 TaxID=3108821 RepID=UPI002DB7B725|nr:WYL domain-containing protein [Actinacidiphila sp. DG2A-62]MEC3994028.1 WYL domain-containing protein [Actinacidiphila sp. DG2A-62]
MRPYGWGITMKLTKNQTEQQTLTALLRAADRRHPVTITYLKEEKDAAGKKTGRLVETVRTIEIYDVITTKAGHITLKAMDRETGESRTFRLDRIVSYTIHRTAYTVAVPVDEAPARPVAAPTSPAALVAYELGRDERPAARQLATAA